MKSVIIDTDPGIDDAVALGVALSSESLDVKLITTVAGNVSLEQTTRNANVLLNFWGKDIPLARGFSKPLIVETNEVKSIHGETGLGGFEFPQVKKNNEVDRLAIHQIYKVINESEEIITIIALGPLTNIAMLIKNYPDVVGRIEIVCMGGSTERGNETATAEYNFHADPHAAYIVVHSGVKVTMIGLNVTNRALFDREFLDSIKNCNKTGKMIDDMFSHYRGGSASKGYKMHDLCAVLYTIDNSIFEIGFYNVEICTNDDICRGQSVVDLMNKSKVAPNVYVATDLEIGRFKATAKKNLLKLI